MANLPHFISQNVLPTPPGRPGRSRNQSLSSAGGSKNLLVVLDRVDTTLPRQILEVHEVQGETLVRQGLRPLSQNAAAQRKRKSRSNRAVRDAERNRENEKNATKRKHPDHKKRLCDRAHARQVKMAEQKKKELNFSK